MGPAQQSQLVPVSSLPPVTSADGIAPDECNFIHNIPGCFAGGEVLEALPLDEIYSVGYGFQIELTYRVRKLGFKIAQTPIIFPDRSAGQSKMSGAIFQEALWGVWKIRLKV